MMLKESLFIGGHWLGAHDGDPRALALFKRHYSYRRRAHGQARGNNTFIGQGEKMVLLTLACDALFVWQFSTVPRRSGQEGVCCSVFRNESPCLSSELIQAADEMAWRRWPGQRHYTYINPKKVRSSNPGFCFLKAGWRRCGTNKSGQLIVLERLPSRL